MQPFRSLLYEVFLVLTVAVYGTAILLSFWMPFEDRYAWARRWARLQLGALRVLCGIRYTVEGREHIPAGGHVTLWRHSSTWETIAQQVICPPQAWVLKRELMWIPIFGWATWLLDPIAIDRGAGLGAMRQVIAKGRRRLAQGRGVIIYPEGTRLAPGQRGKYGMSGALLATTAGCPIVPVAHNAGCYWPKGGLFGKKPGTIHVVIGPAIATQGRDAREVNEEVRAWIDAKVTALGG
jgi:1-acyl-sn-glycerol-3-phosphate acyltransferase